FFAPVRAIELMRAIVADATLNRGPVEHDVSKGVTNHRTSVDTALAAASADIANLEEQFQNRQSALADNESELAELTAAAELARSWIGIETQVKHAKEADRLRLLKRSLAQLSRSVTELAKTASDQLINQSFDALFNEECNALRAPQLKVQFVGREGR